MKEEQRFTLHRNPYKNKKPTMNNTRTYPTFRAFSYKLYRLFKKIRTGFTGFQAYLNKEYPGLREQNERIKKGGKL